MKVVINTTVIMSGGGLQVAISFLNELKDFGKDDYFVFLSNAVSNHIIQDIFPSNFNFFVFKKSPAHLKNRLKVVNQLNKCLNEIQPRFVFSVFGPTYWKPKVIHIMGFGQAFILYKNYEVVKKLNIKSKFEFKYKEYEIKRNADFYITESEDAASELRKILNNKAKKVFTVGNTYGSFFDKFNILKEKKRYSNKFTLITISTNSLHKNLIIIIEVVDELIKLNLEILFVITIKEEDYKNQFKGYEKYVMNLGPVRPQDCPEIYSKGDVLFLPTLLEVFSASYPEAMKMEKPILTSDLGFARSICKDAALYFDPNDPKDIAEKIYELFRNKDLQQELIEKGKKRLKSFPTAKQRAEKYMEICKNIVN